jgi:hypothetical protein
MQNHSLYIHYTDEAQKAETVPIYLPLDETLLWQPQIYPLIEHYTDEAQKVPSVYIARVG